MSATQTNQQSNARGAASEGAAAPHVLTSVSEPLLPYGQAFCHFTQTSPEEVDWKPEAISLVGLWMKAVHDLQVSDSGWALVTAFVRLDTIRATGATQGLLPADVAGRMDARAKDCFQYQGKRLLGDESSSTLSIEGSVSVGVGGMGSLRTRGATVH